jgi:hypothetical protein
MTALARRWLCKYKGLGYDRSGPPEEFFPPLELQRGVEPLRKYLCIHLFASWR